MTRSALFPGSFDPITIGHVDIIRRALPLFDAITIAIGVNTKKQYLFPLAEREAWIADIFANEPKITVATYTGLTADYCRAQGINYLIRGVRNTHDFEFEQTIAQLNRSLDSKLETVFLATAPALGHISSTIVREILINKGDASAFLPPEIAKRVMQLSSH